MTMVFFSYTHKDEALRDQLATHLVMLRRQGLIDEWHDRRISAGTELDGAITAHLEAADVVLLLVSPDFLASDYCYEKEMMRAMERHDEGSARVIPVILRPCDWHRAPFGKLLATPTDGRAVTKWLDLDEAFLDVTQSIRRALEELGTTAVPAAKRPDSTTRSSPVSAALPPVTRSSNLQIAKQFSERDRDLFLHEAFDYVAKFFENSLTELQQRNPGIEGTFRRIDAERFTAVIYRNGSMMSECAVSLGRQFSPSIAYSENPRMGGVNEMLAVDADEQALFLKPFMSGAGGRRAPQKLTMSGGAELLWARLIASLQRG